MGPEIQEMENRNRKKIKLDKGLSTMQLGHGNAGDRRGVSETRNSNVNTVGRWRFDGERI